MSVENVIQNCIGKGANTGIGSCFNDIRFIKGMIFVPAGKKYATTSIAGLKALIEADILNDDATQRAYPIGGFVKPTDNSTKPVEDKFPTGAIAIVNDGFYDWSFQFIKGGLCLSIAMQKANGLNRWFFLYDDAGKLYGTDAGLGFIQGINPNLAYTPPFELNTGTATTVYQTRVNFTPDQLNVNAKFVDFANDGGLTYLTNLNGLIQVSIQEGAAPTSTVIKVKAVTSCGTVDLYDSFADAFATPDAWVVLNKANSGIIVISAVAKVPSIKGWSLTLTSATGLTVGASLAGPTELAASPIDAIGYESDSLTEIIP